MPAAQRKQREHADHGERRRAAPGYKAPALPRPTSSRPTAAPTSSERDQQHHADAAAARARSGCGRRPAGPVASLRSCVAMTGFMSDAWARRNATTLGASAEGFAAQAASRAPRSSVGVFRLNRRATAPPPAAAS